LHVPVEKTFAKSTENGSASTTISTKKQASFVSYVKKINSFEHNYHSQRSRSPEIL